MSKVRQISLLLENSVCLARTKASSAELTTPWLIRSSAQSSGQISHGRWMSTTPTHGGGDSLKQHVLDKVDALKQFRFMPIDILQKKKAVSMQMESLWDRHQRKLYGLAACLVSYTVWKSMRFTASAFVNVSESLAVTGVTTLGASATLMAAAWYYRRTFTISPSAVYRMAMIRLNTHPGVLEVMGAPVVGSDVRASVLTGGGIKLFPKPKLKKKRVQMMFPLKGSERKGLVSLEAKKNRSGKLVLSLLAVDVARERSSLLGGQRTEDDTPYDRIYIEGGIKQYERGNVLNELRKPFLNALKTDWQEVAEVEDDEIEKEIEKRKRFNVFL